MREQPFDHAQEDAQLLDCLIGSAAWLLPAEHEVVRAAIAASRPLSARRRRLMLELVEAVQHRQAAGEG